MKTIVTALFLVLIVSLCFGGVVGKMVVRQDGDITRIVGQSQAYGSPWVTFYRDLNGDGYSDRVKLRMWCLEKGFSLPVMVFVDNDLDRLCDGLYYCDLDMTVGEVWASESLVLKWTGCDAVGKAMMDLRPLSVKVDKAGKGC